MNIQKFAPGIRFESHTFYHGDQQEYHIYHADTQEALFTAYNRDRQFLQAGFVLDHLEDITVDLGGARLIFHGRILPFMLNYCNNITLKNFSIDYDRPFYTQAEILEAGSGKIEIKICENFPYRVEGNRLIICSDTWENTLGEGVLLLQPFDRKTLSPAYDAGCILATIGNEMRVIKDNPLPIHRLTVDEGKNGTVILYGDFPETYKEGQILAMTHEDRRKPGFVLKNSDDTVLDNIRIIHSGSSGIVANLCNNITLRHFNMFLDQNSKGVVTINSDCVHCIHCTGKICIEDCIFENMLDDAVNIHGNYTVVDKVTGKNQFIVNNVAADTGLMQSSFYKAGDNIYIYKGRTQEPIGRYILSDIENLGKNQIKLSVLEPVSHISNGDIVENQRMPEIEIRRCRTGRNRPRGFLISSGKKTIIEDCYFNNCSVGVHFTGDTTFWYESGPVGDVTIKNCHFKDCGYCGSDFAIMATPEFEATEGAPYYHRGIKIIGNTFETFTDGTLYASRTDDIVYKNNVYIPTDSYPKRKRTKRIVLEQCGRTDIQE